MSDTQEVNVELDSETRVRRWAVGASRPVLVGLAVAVALGFAAFVGSDLGRGWIQTAAELRQWGLVGMALFIVGFAVAAAAFFPGSVLMTASGAAFGFSWGFGTAVVGATAGALVAFLIGRYAARGKVQSWIHKRPHFTAIESAIASKGWRLVALTRCCPVLPYIFQNYAYGLTRISVVNYAVGSFIGLAPSAFIFAYLGSLSRAGLEAAASPASIASLNWLHWAGRGLGLVATVILTVWITRMARRALHEAGVTGV